MRETLVVGTRERTMTVIGAGADLGQARESPDLLLVFHGSTQSGERFRRFTGCAFDALASGGKTVVAYLDGYRGHWNDGRVPSSFAARVENIDDTGFASAVIARLRASHGIDPTRVFAAGYSNGGEMVLRLLHESPGMLAGAAAYSATMPDAASFDVPGPPRPAVPVPVLLIHGTDDPIVPYEGGRMSPLAERLLHVGGRTLSAADTAAYFARRNRIDEPPRRRFIDRESSARHGTWVEEVDFRQTGRPPVRLITVHGGGHTVPGPGHPPAILGRVNRTISASALTADFLGIRTG